MSGGRRGALVVVVLLGGIAIGYVTRDRIAPPSPAPMTQAPAAPGLPPASVAPRPSSVATPAVTVVRKPEGATRGPVSLSYQDLEVPASRRGATIAEMRADLAAGKPVDLYRLFHLLESCAREQGCTAAPAEELDRRFELLDRAAAAGDLRAQVQFARHVPDELRGEENLFRHPEKVVEWKAKRAAYLEAAAERGSHDAFLTLASIHREERPGGDSGVAALAYYLAWAETQPRGTATQQSREFYGQGLTPDQVRRAETLRDRMLARCCR